MLRIAVQSKGRLFEETMALLQEADIKIPSSKRILLVQSSNFPVEAPDGTDATPRDIYLVLLLA